MTMNEHTHKPTLRIHKPSIFSYWPIVLLYVLAGIFAFGMTRLHVHAVFMVQLMGFIIFFFGLIKMNDPKGFATSFAKYDPFAKFSSLYAKLYPFIEILLGSIFIFQILLLPTTVVTFVVYIVTLYGAWKSITSKEELYCACVGTYFKLPLSKVSIVESSIMVGMCIYMVFITM
jgi:hypothetical protein